jgi:serine/threonine-protein kinase
MTPTLIPGTVVAQRYRLTRLLGAGGMGMVWAATHMVTRRQVAIKMPHQSVRPEIRRRFLREARAVSAIDHPNVVRVYDAFELEDGTPIIVMDLLEGETFGALLQRKQVLTLSETARVLLPVVSAVGTAHEFGVTHRDLKPDNVFLATIDGRTIVKVLDFGIAKLEVPEDGQGTTTGSAVGTPCYMSPEQSLGEKDTDHRVDVWAIGVMLYEALSGGRPVEGDNLGQIVKRLLTEVITPIGILVPDLAPDVRSLVDRMLARTPSDRLDDLREAMSVLSRHGEAGHPTFGAPRSKSIPSDFPPLQDVGLTVPGPHAPVTTNAPETLRSSPPVATVRPRRLGVGAGIVGAALATTALIVAWPKAKRAPASGPESISASGISAAAISASATTHSASLEVPAGNPARSTGDPSASISADKTALPAGPSSSPLSPRASVAATVEKVPSSAKQKAGRNPTVTGAPAVPMVSARSALLPVATSSAGVSAAPSGRPRSRPGLAEDVPF